MSLAGPPSPLRQLTEEQTDRWSPSNWCYPHAFLDCGLEDVLDCDGSAQSVVQIPFSAYAMAMLIDHVMSGLENFVSRLL